MDVTLKSILIKSTNYCYLNKQYNMYTRYLRDNTRNLINDLMDCYDKITLRCLQEKTFGGTNQTLPYAWCLLQEH